MILTFLYMVATSIQSRRILFLKNHLRSLFQGDTTTYPSIMFYNKTLALNKGNPLIFIFDNIINCTVFDII